MRNPAGLVTASVIGGGLLFLIMYYGILPLLNPIMAGAPASLGVGVVGAAALTRGGLVRGASRAIPLRRAPA